MVLKPLDKIQVRVTRRHMRGTEVANLVIALRDVEILHQFLRWLGFVDVAMILAVIEILGSVWVKPSVNCINV